MKLGFNKSNNIVSTISSVVFCVLLCTLVFMPVIVSARTTDGNVGLKITAGRQAALMTLGIGLISMAAGILSLRPSTHGSTSGRVGAIVALILGLIGIVLAGRHLFNATGRFGTGSGRLGAIVAIVVGLIGMILGGKAFIRFRNNVGSK